ncbi:MAG: aldo/keto reductase [Lachnospiraceae bacterium]|nr:aldo/keto reductase [Lachnospiraceae bacterium]
MYMEEITLNNGISVPKIGLGMWDAYGDEAAGAVSTALKLGYRRVDTAMFYKNEPEVGRGIQMSGIPREEIFVSTKIWFTDMEVDKVRPTFEKSLDNLQLDYIDMYMLHWPMGDVTGSWKVLEELYEEGKVKGIGVCNFQKHHMEDLLKTAKIKPMINQIESHPTFSQNDLVLYCQEQGIQPEVWSPLGRGDDLNNPVIKEIAQKYDKTTAQVILRWHMQRGVTAIPKSVKEHRMMENTSVFDFRLTEEEMAVILAQETGTPRGGYREGYTWE